jgi:hypothetical protein
VVVTDKCGLPATSAEFLIGVDGGDCNGNGMADGFDVALDESIDCNHNGRPDECEQAFVELASPALSPLGAGYFHFWTLTNPIEPLADVTLHLSAVGDLDEAGEYVLLALNGIPLEPRFVMDGSDCPRSPDMADLAIARGAWLDAVGDGDAMFMLSASTEVAPFQCRPTFLGIAVAYQGVAPLDVDADGEIDTCEPGHVTGDLNADNVVNGFDLALLLGSWGPCQEPLTCPADLNGNGVVNGIDLATLLGNWS